MADQVRALALSVLNRCMAAEQYSNIALDTALRRSTLPEVDRGLLTALVYGVLERRLTLDYAIRTLSDRPLEEIDLETQDLLRLGLYQMAYLSRIPDHAAVNETVALAPRRSRGFVNALLRAFVRGGKELPLPKEADTVAFLSVKYSFSPAICARFCEDFGPDRTAALLAAFCEPAPLTLRVNTLKMSREELLMRLRADGFDAMPTEQSRAGIRLPTTSPTALFGFEEGAFLVQDEASQLCVEALALERGMTLLDTCACPGSKSFGAAIDMQNEGRILSCDLHANKLSLVRSGAERLGISIIETLTRDAREPREEWREAFDRVLCDVPCSGFGVFAKKPELRYKDPAASAALPDIQLAILQNSAAFVKRGGRLVYSTCTLLPAENGDNIARFLRENKDFTCIGQRTLWPDVDHTDGFFYAVLQKL